jgi:glutamate/tyrosine decarboxylase-like PLP-dependent enzyme
MSAARDPRLQLSGDDMRRLGYRAIDAIVEHFETVAGKPALLRGEAEALRARLSEPAPAGGHDPDDVLDRVLGDVLPHMQHGDHPRFFARVPSPGNYVSVVADALASGFNVFAGSWAGGSGAATIELTTLEWLRDLVGMPAGSEGVFLSGGSVASLTAIAAARLERAGEGPSADAVVYLSDQTHASVVRALRILGFAPDRVRKLPTGPDLRLPVAALAEAVDRDRRGGLSPLLVVATAGTTNTGAVDPLTPLADLCAEHGLWLHVDGAYGAPTRLTARGGALLEGLGRADSIALDPHKWLFQPYEAGVLLVRDPGLLQRAFAMFPEYLADVTASPHEVDFRDRGPQLTRGFRALKLWMTIQVFGLDAVRAGIDHGLDLAEHAEAVLRADPRWEVVTPAQLGVVTWTPADTGAPACHELVEALTADGHAAISSTVLHGRTVLRLCTINPRTTREDVESTIARLARML